MKLKHHLLRLSMLLFSGIATGLAQEVKKETEVSIPQDQMPAKSLQVLAPFLQQGAKAHFYRETDGQRVSYESKLTWQGHRLSIEFHGDGSLMDIEQLVSFQSLQDTVRKQLESRLAKELGRYKIQRVQVQFSAASSSLPDADVVKSFLEGDYQNMAIRYEIESDARTGSKVGAYELLFDGAGNLLNRRAIFRRPLDNLLY